MYNTLYEGISTGSVYKDVALLRNGFPAESVDNGSVIAVKTHEWGPAARQQFQVLLLNLSKTHILSPATRKTFQFCPV